MAAPSSSPSLFAALLSFAACGASPPTDPPPLDDVGEIAQATVGAVRVTALRTGWVRVKRPHQEYRGIDALRFPAIVMARRWGPWMPVISYVVEHPDRTVMVDTGVAVDINDEAYFACDPQNEWFYRKNLMFHSAPSEGLASRLAAAGIEGEAVDAVVVTHFHGDHIGGFDAVPNAEILTGPGNFPEHVGAFVCRMPEGRTPTFLDYANDPEGQFTGVVDLVPDGSVQAVELRGHTPGHVGVRVNADGRTVVMVGDATFDRGQTERLAVTGAAEEMGRSRETQARVREVWNAGAVVLPSHDPTVFLRLADLDGG
ncbi:MAG: MBL fold metallo-hydrolase [Myxococcota bacterium]